MGRSNNSNVRLSGVASATTNISKGNTLCYDALNSVYYLGGTFNGTLQFTGILGQTITPYSGYDAFIARFQDNGGADYKSLQFFKDSLSKAENSNVIIYPNPSSGNFTITSITNEVITNVLISDLTGRLVYRKDYNTDVFETNADISFLPISTYFISISTTNNVYNKKIVIVK